LIETGASSALVGLISNGGLLLGSYWIARCGLRQRSGLEVWLAAAIVFWTCCTLGLEMDSALGVISRGAIVLEAGLVLAGGAVARWLTGPHGPDVRHEGTSSGLSWDARAALALVLSAAMFLGMRSLLLAVKVVSDGPIYHLYFATRWWKAGRLILVAAPFGENAASYFPANGDLWFTWLLASWGGDRLARIGQAPFLVLAFLAAYACARTLGAGRSASVVASCWFVSSTPLLIYSFEPNVDTIFIAGYMVAAYFFLRAARRHDDTASLCLGGLAAGLALGTKPVGVVFIPPLLLLAVAAVLMQPIPARKKALQAVLAVGLPLVTGGYWFLRNALLAGNPVYPLEVRFFGRTLLEGCYGPEAMRFSQYYVPFREWRALCDTLLAVLDPRMAPLWIVALSAGWALARREDPGARRWIAVFSLMAILNVALYWVCIPYRSQQRFMLQALGVGVVPLAITLERWRWLRLLAVILLGLHLLTPQTWPLAGREASIPWDFTPLVPNAVSGPIPLFSRLQLAASLPLVTGSSLSLVTLFAVVTTAAFLVWSWCRAVRRSGIWQRECAVAMLASALFVFVGFVDLWGVGIDARVRFYPPFADFYRGWAHFDYEAGPAGTRVAYAGTNIPYYLLGDGLRNEVRYINIDRHREWLLHDYHHDALERGEGHWPNSRPGWDRMQPEYEAWVENLDAERIELLVVTRVNPREGSHNVADREGFPIERVWADLHPERFEPLYGLRERDPWFRLYRVHRPRIGSQVPRAGPTARPAERPT
jgi:Dolichyl-phosphate-mannose-protein mannosyltransferase